MDKINSWKLLLIALVIWGSFMVCKNNSNYEADKNRYLRTTEVSIHEKVCNDFVQQYEIAARQGDKMQMYVQAGMCSAAFLQAKDEQNYKKWKEIETNLARQVGIK